MPDRSIVRALVDLRDMQIQRARIQFGNRVDAITREADEASGQQSVVVRRYYKTFDDLEKQINSDVAELMRGLPIYDELQHIRGIGPLLAAKVLALIGGISSFDTVSKLWRFAGYAVIEGAAERPVKGEKLHYNRRLKTALYLVAVSFLRSHSPYADLYSGAKARYEQAHPDWTAMHRHRAALRIPIKVFLSHLWERWRDLEGLPTRALYVHEQLGHTTLYQPHDFGWDGKPAVSATLA